MIDRDFVTARVPAAFCFFNADTGCFKIYSDRVCFVGISDSCGTEAAAWRDAARRIRERDAMRLALAKETT